MKKKTNLLFLCFLYCLPVLLKAQKVNTDSLEQLLQNKSLHDTIQLRLLLELSAAYSKTGSDKALSYTGKAISRAKKLNNSAAHGQALFNSAVYCEKVSLYDSSLYLLREARRIANGADQKLEANIEETMGMNYFRKSSTDSSLACFEKALTMQSALNDSTHILVVLNNLGILNSIKGNNLKGQEYFLKCLKIHEKRQDSVSIARSYNNLGLLMLKAKLLNKAGTYFRSAIAIAILTKDSANLVNAHRNMAIAYENEKKYDEAIAENLKALPYISGKKISQRASVEHALSSCYLMKNDNETALKYLLPALKVKEMLGEKGAITGLLNNLASIKLDMGKYDEAITAALRADKLADETESVETKKKASEILLECYIKTGNRKMAMEMYNKFMSLNDSLYSLNLSSNLAEVQTKYETEKKETENELLKKENSIGKLKIEANNQKIKTRNITILVLVMVLLLAGSLIFWRSNAVKLKQKTQQLEAEQKLQSEKERISRDLHDNVGGQLSYVLYTLEGKNSSDLTKQPELIGNIQSTVKSVIGNLRETIWAINDQNILMDDFSDKLKVYARNIFKYTATKIEFKENIETNITINSIVALNLFRICQEIIHNAFKHAEASNFKINLHTKEKITIVLTDDGKGFKPENTANIGYGMENIKLRAAEIGATLEFNSKSGKGTEYKLVI